MIVAHSSRASSRWQLLPVAIYFGNMTAYFCNLLAPETTSPSLKYFVHLRKLRQFFRLLSQHESADWAQTQLQSSSIPARLNEPSIVDVFLDYPVN
jgi:hypothetical protein